MGTYRLAEGEAMLSVLKMYDEITELSLFDGARKSKKLFSIGDLFFESRTINWKEWAVPGWRVMCAKMRDGAFGWVEGAVVTVWGTGGRGYWAVFTQTFPQGFSCFMHTFPLLSAFPHTLRSE